ncbi:Hpt domain-containing protein [Flectobacillus roseus]|uniref:Hpt domain-containing protein n=1 Tax=Flectobacillus roseus TaxID=502259 RepID=A0ABT6YEA1_9BACT|nr:Hpt domain-containing protein [Flectobacillus roseus]MDI9861908.1 Hpt domain-containing protein [Flectobacillus roseus]
MSLESFPFHPSFDKEYIAELFDNEASYFLEIMEYFFNNIPTEMSELNETFASGDKLGFAKKLHKMSSMLGCVGQIEFSQLCKEVEKTFLQTQEFIVPQQKMIEDLQELLLHIQNDYDKIKMLTDEAQ